MLDCLVSGEIFSASTYTEVARLFPPDGGYTGLLYGKVVDMFYFPIIHTTWPDWVPYYGGEEFIFFSPVFNFADACISVSVIYMLIFQRNFFAQEETKKKTK